MGVHSGLPSGAASDLSSAFDAMRVGAKAAERRDRVVPAIIFHGDADPIGHPSNGDALAAQALGRATGLLRTTEHGRAPGGLPMSASITYAHKGQTMCERGASVIVRSKRGNSPPIHEQRERVPPPSWPLLVVSLRICARFATRA